VSEQAVQIKMSGSWSTQMRFTQGIGRALSELMPVRVSVIVQPGRGALENGDVDVIYSKSINNEHQFTGRGLYAGTAPAPWLRTIAWLPQEDRILFAVAPWVGVACFEALAAKKPALRIAGGRNSPFLLKQYGFSYEDMESWGCRFTPMRHTWAAARARFDAGELDMFIGDGSEYDFSAWRFVASRGFKFLDIRADVMEALERDQRIRRITTPAGFLPGITQDLSSIDDSHIVVDVHERLDERVAYNLAKAIDERKRDIETTSIQVGYADDEHNLPLTHLSYWSSLTGPIERQWDERILCAPLHPGAARYYEEKGYLKTEP